MDKQQVYSLLSLVHDRAASLLKDDSAPAPDGLLLIPPEGLKAVARRIEEVERVGSLTTTRLCRGKACKDAPAHRAGQQTQPTTRERTARRLRCLERLVPSHPRVRQIAGCCSCAIKRR